MKAPEDETMKWKRNAKDGVSPVIAVILMVAITVVLAGVVVLWVTRLSKTEEEGPEMLTLDVKLYDTTNDYIEIYNNGGGTINWANYKITIDGQSIGTLSGTTEVGEKITFTSGTDEISISVDLGTTYLVKVINTVTNKVVWEREVTAQVP